MTSNVLHEKDQKDQPFERTGDCSVSWVSSYKELPAGLLDNCFDENVEGSWWYRTLEDSGLTDQFQFHYAIISLAGKAIGVAPAFVMELPMDLVVPDAVMPLFQFIGKFYRAALFQRTLFIGSPCADEGTIGLLPGMDLQKIAPQLEQSIESLARTTKAEMIVWKDFPKEAISALDWVVEERDMFLTVSYPGTTAHLQGIKTLDQYFNSALNSNGRLNLKKKLKRSRSFARLRTTVEQAPSDAVLSEVFRLFCKTYEKSDTKFEKLNLEFFKLIAKVPNAWFVLLHNENTDKLAAFMLCFKLKNKIINKFIGLDYKNSQMFLYYRLFESAVEWAIACGTAEFQSGQTGYRAKVELGSKLVPLTNVCKHRNPLVHYLYREGAKTITWSTLDKGLAHVLKSHPEYEGSRPWETPDGSNS